MAWDGVGRETDVAMRATMACSVRAMGRPGFGKEGKPKPREVRRDRKETMPADPEATAFEARLERLKRSAAVPPTTTPGTSSAASTSTSERKEASAAAFPALGILLAGAFAWTFAFGDGPATVPSNPTATDVEESTATTSTTFGKLRATVEALCASGKQDEALVRVERAASESTEYDALALLLLQASVYSGWEGHAADAAALYDKAVDEHREDFRAYLARGAFLQTQGQKGEAQRMFIQAKYYAPADAKGFVNRVANR